MITVLTLVLVALIGGGVSGVIGVVAPAIGGAVALLFGVILVSVIALIVDNVKYHKALKR